MLNEKIKTYLENLDQEQKALTSFYGEHDIAQAIKTILKEDKDYKPTKEDVAEQMAFDFMGSYPKNDDSGWGTYYGPMFVLPNDKGQMIEYPSVKLVDQTILEYWGQRAKESKNPILSSRYADLVVDFSPKILNKSAGIELIQLVIDSNATICTKLLMDPLDCKDKIKRALFLAIKISDQSQKTKAKKVIIELEKRIAANDNEPGLWGFAFKWLLLDFAEKITLESTEEIELIDLLEKRLIRVKKDPWPTEHAASLLAEYYKNQKDERNLMRVLQILEDTFKTSERMNADALLKIHSYEQTYEIYKKYSSFPEANKATKRLLQEMGQLDLDLNKTLKEISVTLNIKQEDIDSHLKEIFDQDEINELERIMSKIAVYHLPKKDGLEKSFDETSKKNPIQFLCTKQVFSDDGVLIAKFSGLEEGYNNHFQAYAREYINFNSVFLSSTIDELKKRFSREEIIEYIEKSSIFENENKEFIKRAISSYWSNDYLVSSHLFIPLIESGIRELIKVCSGIILY